LQGDDVTSSRTEAEAQFPNNVKDHKLTIIRDEGLYRHLRFRQPSTSNMWFDIITWPGYLAFVGDMGDWVFARDTDMLEFFRGDRINPSYWGEKIQAGEYREYSGDVALKQINEGLEEGGFTDEEREEALEIATDGGEEYTRIQINDSCLGESLRDASFDAYTYHYIWACLALVWGIEQYDAAKETK